MGKYKIIPDTCKNFTVESFDRLKGFQYIALQETPEIIGEDWLCTVCSETECDDRKVDGPGDLYGVKVKKANV